MEYQLINNSAEISQLTAVERVLLNRGITPENVDHYLHTTDGDILDPKLLMNMREGASMLAKHIAAGSDVLIQVDSDTDGFTSAALLINYIVAIYPAFAQNHIQYRLHTGKQHGLLLETIPENVKLVIAPDSSSNDLEVHAALAERSVDVLILDHHNALQVSPNACVINNQLCDYPNKSLSGVGIVYKFCCYLDELLGINEAEKYLDLVALGLVADVMDLRPYETRHLITRGLSQLRNPFFKAMVEKQSYSLGGEVTPIGVAFYIAPYVNATIRMGTQDEKLILFESMLDNKGYEFIASTKRGCKGQQETIVEQACRNCTNIKNRQTKARDSALENIEILIEKEHLLDNKILIVKLEDGNVEKNLTGLLANQLMGKYQRPVLLLNKIIGQETNEVSWMGSGRGYSRSKFKDLREFLQASGYVDFADGHAEAFGTSIPDRSIDKLITYSNQQLADFDFTPCYKVDFIFNAGDFNSTDIIEIAELKSLWGQGVEEPYVAVEHIKVNKDNLKLMSPDKNPTLKITLPNGTSLIKFKSSQDEYESLYSANGYVMINVVGRCERNIWNGIVSPQILIESYEIVGEQKYYF